MWWRNGGMGYGEKTPAGMRGKNNFFSFFFFFFFRGRGGGGGAGYPDGGEDAGGDVKKQTKRFKRTLIYFNTDTQYVFLYKFYERR